MRIPNDVLKMRKTDGIYITPIGYTYNPGINKIKESLQPKQYKDFQIYASDIITDAIIKAIDSQRYKSTKWPPLSVRYVDWKRRKKYSLKIWECTGFMKKHIRVFRKGNFIAIGFMRKDCYPKTRVTLNQIAKYVEFGTPKMPARPLFRQIVLYYRKNVSRLFKNYQKELVSQKKNYLYL